MIRWPNILFAITGNEFSSKITEWGTLLLKLRPSNLLRQTHQGHIGISKNYHCQSIWLDLKMFVHKCLLHEFIELFSEERWVEKILRIKPPDMVSQQLSDSPACKQTSGKRHSSCMVKRWIQLKSDDFVPRFASAHLPLHDEVRQ